MTCNSRSQQKHAETHIKTPQFCEYFQGKCHILYGDNLHCRNRLGYFMQHLLPAITNTNYNHHFNFPHIHFSSLYTRTNTQKKKANPYQSSFIFRTFERDVVVVNVFGPINFHPIHHRLTRADLFWGQHGWVPMTPFNQIYHLRVKCGTCRDMVLFL